MADRPLSGARAESSLAGRARHQEYIAPKIRQNGVELEPGAPLEGEPSPNRRVTVSDSTLEYAVFLETRIRRAALYASSLDYGVELVLAVGGTRAIQAALTSYRL